MASTGKRIFVTGTDTSIGKTEVSCAIAAALDARGINVGVYKPAETGCSEGESGLVGEDCVRLSDAAGRRQSPSEVASYLFRLPAAPLVAAEAEGTHVDPDLLVADCERIAGANELTIIEGAGGLLVPIAESFTYADLAARLEAPVVVVVGSRLGCINHALLTFEALRTRGLTALGYVMNTLSPENAAFDEARSNRATIARFTDLPDLGLLPYLTDDDRSEPSACARLAESTLSIKALL
jgi:dethiobiotin synthetase